MGDCKYRNLTNWRSWTATSFWYKTVALCGFISKSDALVDMRMRTKYEEHKNCWSP